MSTQKILILGITSNIGFRLYALNDKHKIFGICRKWPLAISDDVYEFHDIDIRHIENVVSFVNPDIIVNCINVADVDKCETDREAAYLINYRLCSQVADLCNARGIKAVNFSSSFVYSGASDSYGSESMFSPVNEYGKIKEQSDIYLRNYLSNGILIRPTTIVGKKEFFQRENPVSIICKKILNNENIFLVEDVETNILFLDDLVYILLHLIDNDINGEFNVGGPESVSRYELACRLLKFLPENSASLKKCRAKDFATAADRPQTIVLENTELLSKIDFRFTQLDDFLPAIITEMELF